MILSSSMLLSRLQRKLNDQERIQLGIIAQILRDKHNECESNGARLVGIAFSRAITSLSCYRLSNSAEFAINGGDLWLYSVREPDERGPVPLKVSFEIDDEYEDQKFEVTFSITQGPMFISLGMLPEITSILGSNTAFKSLTAHAHILVGDVEYYQIY